MQDLIIEKTQYTPSISMLASGEVLIEGKSYPENTFEFYKPVLQWLEDFFANNTDGALKVVFEIIYFNSSSSKVFFDLFDILNLHKDTHKVTVVWQYDEENESALEAGEDFVDDFPELDIALKAVG
jgi:hypothetical protein